MYNTKKTLLIFFGEFRTFSVIPQQLFDLDKVDIIFSTWKKIKTWGTDLELEQSQIDLCYKLLPNIKLLLNDYIYFEDIKQYNSDKMYYHWRTAINSVEDETLYDRVLFHRCDMISNWHTILSEDWKPNTLYIQTGGPDKINEFWINDYYLGGDFKTVKRFVNLFKDINNPLSHFVIGNKILENNFNWENLRLKTFLIREWQRDFISVLNDISIKLITQDRSSKYAKQYIELHNEAQPDFKLHISNFT
jgi:hypothetical protein